MLHWKNKQQLKTSNRQTNKQHCVCCLLWSEWRVDTSQLNHHPSWLSRQPGNLSGIFSVFVCADWMLALAGTWSRWSPEENAELSYSYSETGIHRKTESLLTHTLWVVTSFSLHARVPFALCVCVCVCVRACVCVCAHACVRGWSSKHWFTTSFLQPLPKLDRLTDRFLLVPKWL